MLANFSQSEQALGLVQSCPERTRIDFKKSIGLFRSLTSCPTILLLSLSSVAALPDALSGVKSDATPCVDTCVDNRYPNANFAKPGLISLFAWLSGYRWPKRREWPIRRLDQSDMHRWGCWRN